MRIKFTDFRCYTSETFDFSDNELILISAESGAGKSTILMGIQFCLYGTGSKLQHYGKTSCKVELEFEDMKIVRSKRPNRLVINDLYEDEIAQNIINKKFGDAFNVTSYICQNAINSFILMSPPDKLEFLEKFAFKDVNLPEIKNKSKKLCNDRNEELNKTLSQLEIASSILKEINEPEKVEFPFRCKASDYEKFAKNEDVKVKNSDILIKKNSNIINKEEKELNDLLILNSYIESKNDIFYSLENKLNELLSEEKKITYIGDEKLEYYKNNLMFILSNKELASLEHKFIEDSKTLENMKIIETEKCKLEIEKIKEVLWKDYDNEEECKKNISELKDVLKDAKKVSFLKKQIKYEKDINLDCKKKELENLKDQLDIKKQYLETVKKQKLLYECPSCKTSLSFKDNKLSISEKIELNNIVDETEIRKEINSINISVKNLENIISDEENNINSRLKIEKEIDTILSQYEEELDENSLQDDIDTLQEYFNTQKKLENKKNNLELTLQNQNFSTSYTLFEKDLDKIRIKLENLKNNIIKRDDNNMNEETLRILIEDAQRSKDSLIQIKKYKKEIEKDVLNYKSQIENMKNTHIEKYKKINDIEYLKKEISSLKVKIDEYQNKKDIALRNIVQIDKYNKYIEEKDKYSVLLEKVKNLQDKEEEDKKKYSAALSFKEKILEAESIAMQNIVDSINTHAQMYLDYFFPDNPINVKLMCFKETKKNNKPQINIEIDYKGMEADLTMLSGGETSRVVLAFTLALGEMFNTPLLLLDECTSSLNQELTTVVFDSIKEHFKGKKIIVVAHQVIEGVFDKIIKLK